MVVRRLKKHVSSFKYAFKGLGYAFKSQPNFQFHALAALAVLGLGFLFGITKVEWLILILAIFLVFTSEILNTALEVVTDGLKAHKKTDKDDFYIMAAKDIGAAAVLLSALGAIIVGLIIFVPKILPR